MGGWGPEKERKVLIDNYSFSELTPGNHIKEKYLIPILGAKIFAYPLSIYRYQSHKVRIDIQVRDNIPDREGIINFKDLLAFFLNIFANCPEALDHDLHVISSCYRLMYLISPRSVSMTSSFFRRAAPLPVNILITS